MNFTKITLATLIAAGAVFTSCSSDDDTVSNHKALETPETYEFTRDGKSTVSFSGQTARLKMVNEIGSAFKETTKTVANFTEMFTDGTGFEDADLNTAGKNVNSKVGEAAGDQDAVQADFVGYYTKQVNEVFPKWVEAATAGTAGEFLDGSSTRYVNEDGLEYNQAFYKGLIGALVVDQAINDYLVATKTDDNGTVPDGKSYTSMEHHWDEAYGYVYGNTEKDALMFKYIGRVDGDSDFAGIAQEIEDAFKLGRAAIVAKNYEVRDAQIEIIQKALSKVIAVRAVYYLQQGKANIGTTGSFHDLSEGYGFVYSLQFTHNPETGKPYFTRGETLEYIAQLEKGNGFWEVSADTLDDISDDIANAFGFTVSQAAN